MALKEDPVYGTGVPALAARKGARLRFMKSGGGEKTIHDPSSKGLAFLTTFVATRIRIRMELV